MIAKGIAAADENLNIIVDRGAASPPVYSIEQSVRNSLAGWQQDFNQNASS